MRISFIIPCYNVDRFVADCLDSVLAQNVADWEALCVDDGSTDDTGAILDEYARRDSRIKVIHQPNQGLSAARNVALDSASGKWLYYLDADDVISPWALEQYMEASNRYPDADLLDGGKVDFIDGSLPQWGGRNLQYSYIDIRNYIPWRPLTGYFQQFMYRRDKFGKIRFVGDSWCEERPYITKCLTMASGIARCDDNCYGLRIRKNSITSIKMTLVQNMAYLDVTSGMLRVLFESGKQLDFALVRGLLTVWTEVQINFIQTHLNPCDRGKAFEYWFGSLKDTHRYHPQTFWRWLTITSCRFLPFRWVAIVLCYWPHRLKLLVYRKKH